MQVFAVIQLALCVRVCVCLHLSAIRRSRVPQFPSPHQYLAPFPSTQFNVLLDAAFTVETLTEVQHRNCVTVTCSAAENPGVGKQMLLGKQEVTLSIFLVDRQVSVVLNRVFHRFLVVGQVECVIGTLHYVKTFVITLRTGLLNCLNARSRGLTFRHRASCI